LQAADFPRIAQRGFDHIRLPIRFSGHAAAASPYTIEPTLFARVDWAVQQAKDAGLAILIDLHHYDELQAAPAVEQERFVALWTQIAEHYQSAPEQVAFELLNEPSGAMDTAWNRSFHSRWRPCARATRLDWSSSTARILRLQARSARCSCRTIPG